MKHILIISVLILTTSYLIKAQVANNDDKVFELLKQVATKTENYQSLKIDFNIYVENMQTGKRDEHIGNLIFKKGFYKLDMMGQIVFADAKTNWTYLKDADEVNITNNQDKQINMVNPQEIFKDYDTNYKIKYIADKFEKNRTLVEFDFFPKQIENKKFSKLSIKVDKTKKQIYSIRYIGKDGVAYLIEISKLVENPQISDAEISFNKSNFPKAEIIDMR